MATHTPAQAIQELVNHTAVLTERLVGLQQEVRKGLQTSPEMGNALTQVVGDTKRMLQAMEHLARLPAFHLDREGLNAAVAAGVRQGISGETGSLATIIEANSKYLDEARSELTDAKERMDLMLKEVQGARNMKMDATRRLFTQIAPVAGVWSVACVLLGVLIGSAISGGDAPPAPAPTTAAAAGTAAPQLKVLRPGMTVALASDAPLYSAANTSRVAFRARAGAQFTVISVSPTGWANVTFQADGKPATGWISPDDINK